MCGASSAISGHTPSHGHTPISRALVHAKATIDVPSPGKLIEPAISCTKQTAGSAQPACFWRVRAPLSKRPSFHVAGGRTFKHVTCLDSWVARSTTITMVQNRSGNSAGHEHPHHSAHRFGPFLTRCHADLNGSESQGLVESRRLMAQRERIGLDDFQ